MLTWQVLRSIYPTHTYHMEDNPAYRDIVATRNVIAKARRAWCLRSLLARLLGHGIFRLPQVLLFHRDISVAWYWSVPS